MNVLDKGIAGFKYRDVLYCRHCLDPSLFDEARTKDHPNGEHVEGQFFPSKDVKGMGWKCDVCGKGLR